jgi:hypothetical protein
VKGPPPPPGAPPESLPPLVLRCRPLPRWLHSFAALTFLMTGTASLSRGLEPPGGGAWLIWQGAIGVAAGACAAYYTARYCFARLLLDDKGFSLRGPLAQKDVSWSEVVDWRRRPQAGGAFPMLLVLHGPDRRRTYVPLIYEESEALEIGLAQRGFPRY